MQIPIVNDTLEMVSEDVEKRFNELEIWERLETIQPTALLRGLNAEEILEIWGVLLSLRLQWKTKSKRWNKKKYLEYNYNFLQRFIYF